ncbi:YdcF family protein [Shewanella salipaludis]|uniref:YdcF family protein n=1 Tax=Shewanella salipaludis TaxID=2723052 RepID=A0A972FZR1_9GAMM|nr:YdcF family protein [Shewanella salipaludis]NMH64544.1 YdcF family protein [Shewanella salipaludis]
MFWVKKLLSQLAMPVPFVCLLLLLVFLFWRHRRLARPLSLLALTLLVLLSSVWGSNLLLRPLESSYGVNNQAITGACLVMVLGSGHDDSLAGSATQQLSPVALARLTEGLRQLTLGQDCKLMVSGWNGETNSRSHARVMADAAMELGVAEDKILLLPLARDTIEEAEYAKFQIADAPFRLVTSATHMPRSMQIFTAQGLQPEAAPTDFLAREDYWWRLDARQLLASQRAIHEYLGQLWFRLKQEQDQSEV